MIDRRKLVEHMVRRFLQWKLPVDFNPDGGVSFRPEHSAEWMAKQGKPPLRHEPVGTNLFDAQQATAMVRYMLDGFDAYPSHPAPDLAEWEKAAEGVTPGPWGIEDPQGFTSDDPAYQEVWIYAPDEFDQHSIAAVRPGCEEALAAGDRGKNAAWIARCSPDNVLGALRSLSARLAEAQMATETQAKLYRQALRRAEAAEARASSIAAELAARKETPND